VAVIVWGERSGDLSGTFCTGRNAVPAYGVYGGYPSSGVYYGPLSGPRVDVLSALSRGHIPTLTELEAEPGTELEMLPSKCVWQGRRSISKAAADVFVMTHPGAGGYGDPLLRDPRAVADDVAEDIVSPQAAKRAYGIILDEVGNPDLEGTERLRRELRELRIAGALRSEKV
jgi:N-methylhydantoinase B